MNDNADKGRWIRPGVRVAEPLVARRRQQKWLLLVLQRPAEGRA